MLDDQDVLGKEAGVDAPARVGRVVDVPEVDADEPGPCPEQEVERRR